MDKQVIIAALYRKYIEPTKGLRPRFIGVEIEMPIVNLGGSAVDFEVVHAMTAEFMDIFSFDAVGIDDSGNIYAAENRALGDILSYDCSYNNLELSFGRAAGIGEIYSRFCEYYDCISHILARSGYTLTGMGVNPNWRINRNIPIGNGRYRMLFHHLHSYTKYKLPMYFHKYPQYGTFSSASQVQLDVGEHELAKVLNTFSKLEPFKAVLFSNSVLHGEDNGLLCCRDMFWENSPHGINPHNIGMYDCEFADTDDILRYIASTSIYCAERGDRYINFEPVNIVDYFSKNSVSGEYFDLGAGEYRTAKITPSLDDLRYHRTFKFEDLTYRGTVEFRSVCCQPIGDAMTVAAFHLGLIEKTDKLSSLLEHDDVIYHNGYTAGELRRLFVREELPPFCDEKRLWEIVGKIVDLAREGLRDRGFGEEKFIDPLYERIALRKCPAAQMNRRLEAGEDMERIIADYARLRQA